MISRKQIETLLRIQGLEPTAPEEEIRSILLSAHYNEDEVSTAITVLRENIKQNTAQLDGLHKIYRTDSGLKPAEISALLGVDVNVSDSEIVNHRRRGVSTGQYFIFLALTLLIALLGILSAMYAHETGPFHPSVQISIL